MNDKFLFVMPESLLEDSHAKDFLATTYQACLDSNFEMYVEDSKGNGILPYPRKPKN